MLSFIPLYANIDARIEAIRNAPVEERFMLMNAFKKEVVHMQEKERIDAITKLRSITQSRHSDRAIKELQKYTKPKYHHTSERVSATKERTEIEYEHDGEYGDEAEDQIENESEDHMEDETEDHIENETEDHIEDETEDYIENETEEHIENETEDHIEDEHDDD